MPTRKQSEILQLQDEITNEISRDAPAIAQTVFGDVNDMPDVHGVPNDRLDAIYRAAYERDDRQWLQGEARRDPEQFMKVVQRLGVQKPEVLPGMAPPQSISGAFAKAAAAPPPAPALPPAVAPVMPPVAGAVPPPALVGGGVPLPVAPGPVGPVVGPTGPPVILGPNGQPLPPSGAF